MADKSYEQFADPIGLAKRIVLSGKADAWWGLAQVPARVLAGGLDRVLYKIFRESSSASAPSCHSDKPQIFLIGGPRSGTTLCYQVLAYYLDVSYFSNFSDLFPRRAVCLSHRLGHFDQKPPRRFKSFYGVASGFKTPSDGFGIWNQWLGEHRYSVDSPIDKESAQAMREYFDRWQMVYNKPFLNKNNRNVDCAVQIANILPNAHFIEVRRDPVAVAKSLLQAREFVQGDRKYPWGLHSHRFVNDGSPVEQVCRQIQSFTRRLDDNKVSIDESRYHQINFDEFRRQPASVIRHLCDAIDGVKLRHPGSLEQLEPFTDMPHKQQIPSNTDDEHVLLAQLLQ